MRFGEALAHARKGRKIARCGWNGKNMYVYMTPGRINMNSAYPKVVN